MHRVLRRSGQKNVTTEVKNPIGWGDTIKQEDKHVRRIDRDVINALIAGHFADPFSYWECIKPPRDWKSVPFYPTYRCVGD